MRQRRLASVTESSGEPRRAVQLAHVRLARPAVPRESTADTPVIAVPGLIWRLPYDEAIAAAPRFEAPDSLVELTVWDGLDSFLTAAQTGCQPSNRRPRLWSTPARQQPQGALWWIPAGHLPSVEEARHRHVLLRWLGPTAEAFTAYQTFPPSSAIYRESTWDTPPDRDSAARRDPMTEPGARQPLRARSAGS